jgi:hypothetical protein
MLGRYLIGLLKSGLSNRRVGARRSPVQVPSVLRPQGNGPMSQNEPVENAVQWIDRYINEASSQSRSDGQQLSPSLRLQVLGQQKVGFKPLLDFQNEQQPVQEIPTPLLPNEF